MWGYKTDYHTHTVFSPDGKDTPAAMCEQALALGLREIAFTDHVEWHPAAPYQPDFDSYFAAIEACRARYGPRGLRVLTGVEMGNPQDYPADARALLRGYHFDITIASLHWLWDKNIQREECFEGQEPLSVYQAYFTDLTYIAAMVEVDIIAHFDRILWQGMLQGAAFDLRRLEPIIRGAWAVVAQRDVALELNASLLRVKPGWRRELVHILRWFREAGGRRVVVNSDAHAVTQIAQNFIVANDVLYAAGFAVRAGLPERAREGAGRVSTFMTI